MWKVKVFTLYPDLFPGHLNTLAGPDFSQAKIYLDQLYWDGAVELHMNASDWFRHGQ